MSSESQAKRYRVLIIDDSRNIHDDFRKVLSRTTDSSIDKLEAELFGEAPVVSNDHIQFRIDSAYQGDEGVTMVVDATAKQDPYAVAFVDMRMPPGMDGLGTIEKLWEIDPQLQVVICSAYSDYSWAEISNRLGQNDRLVILRKPFDNIEVLQLAHALAEKWTLGRRVQSHLDQLEHLVAERTRELHESQSLFRLILENTNDLITVADLNRRRVYSSPAHKRLLGFTPEELVNVSAFENVHPDDRGAVERATSEALATGAAQTVVVRKQHKEKFYLYFETAIACVLDDLGKPMYIVATARDITERHQKEIQTRLNQKLESIGLLAAGIAHEINTPTQFLSDNARFLVDAFKQLKRLTDAYRETLSGAAKGHLVNLGAITELEKECELEYLNGEVPRTLEQSLEGLNRVAKIVRSLKEFSHPGSPTRSPIDLNHAIENAIMVCRHEWKYVADVVTEFDSNLPQVPCLADEFNQAILNLVINAAHAIADARPAGAPAVARGKITVKTQRVDKWAVISVADTGVGIPESIRERIFEPFFTTKPMGKGTGQGLPIVRSVVVGKHQGEVDFTSQVGKGTTFVIKLPLTAPDEKSSAAAA